MNGERLKGIQEKITLTGKEALTHLNPITYARAIHTTAHNFAHNLHYALREEFKLSPVQTKAVELALILPQHLALVGIATDSKCLFVVGFLLMEALYGSVSLTAYYDREARQAFFGPPIDSATPEVTS